MPINKMNSSMSTSERINRLSDKKKLLDILEGRLSPNIEDPDDVDDYVVIPMGYDEINNEFLNKDLLKEVLDILKNEYGFGDGSTNKSKSKKKTDSKGKKTKNDNPKTEGDGKGEKSSNVKNNLDTIKQLFETLNDDGKKSFTNWFAEKRKEELIEILSINKKESTKSDDGSGTKAQSDPSDKEEKKNKEQTTTGEKNDSKDKTNEDKSSEAKTKNTKEESANEKMDTKESNNKNDNDDSADETKDTSKEGDGVNNDGTEKKQDQADYTKNYNNVFFSESKLAKIRKRGDKLDINIALKVKVKGSCFINETVNIKFDNNIVKSVNVDENGYIDCVVELRDIQGIENRDTIQLLFEMPNRNHREKIEVSLNTRIPGIIERGFGRINYGTKRTYHKFFRNRATNKLINHKKTIKMKESLKSRRTQTIKQVRGSSRKFRRLQSRIDKQERIELIQIPLKKKIDGLTSEVELYKGYKRNLWKRSKRLGLSMRLYSLESQYTSNETELKNLKKDIEARKAGLGKLRRIWIREKLNERLSTKINSMEKETETLEKNEKKNNGKFEKPNFKMETYDRVVKILKF